ncbi:MAG: DUF4129 domain-containing protein [Acidimicrobiia bacterium]
MKRSVRILSLTLRALAVLMLGFLVSIAAHSVPGRGAEEPMLDVVWRPGVDVTSVLTWLILIAAVIGAIIMAFSAREAPPPREHKRRGIMVLVLGVIVFALIARYMRSIAETLLPETAEVLGEVGEQPIAESTGNGAWLLSLLVAAVIAAALTRVGLAIRTGAPPIQDLTDGDDPLSDSVVPVASPPVRGVDPRGRIFGAYGDFEQSVEGAGVPRAPSETAARHAGRARTALGLGGGDLSLLSGHHADARFGPDEPSVEDAMEAESASARLRDDIPE